MRTFKDLKVWQEAVGFATDVYATTRKFPKEELYGLASQLQRASVSIASNLAEGSKRGQKEFVQFIKIAQGSGAEIETQLLIAKNLKYVTQKDFDRLTGRLDSISKMLTGLLKSIQK